MKDWEREHSLIWRHNNHKFIQPTPRHASGPFKKAGDGRDRLVTWASVAAILFCLAILVGEKLGYVATPGL